MIVYDKEQCRSVASRLVILTNTLNWIAVAFWALMIGSFMTIVVAFFARDYWWLGAIFGILIGYGFGIHLGSVIHLLIEWLVQMLMTQAEILDRMKNNS